MNSNLLETSEYSAFYKNYIDKSTDEDVIKGLRKNLDTVVAFYEAIPNSKHNYAYDDGKWTIKELLLHLIDAERVFTYRALRIARHDKTPLAGFEQDDYVKFCNADKRSLESIISEYKCVRHATIALFESFSDDDLLQIGVASSAYISVRAIGYILTGHENHHNAIITERYLDS